MITLERTTSHKITENKSHLRCGRPEVTLSCPLCLRSDLGWQEPLIMWGPRRARPPPPPAGCFLPQPCPGARCSRGPFSLFPGCGVWTVPQALFCGFGFCCDREASVTLPSQESACVSSGCLGLGLQRGNWRVMGSPSHTAVQEAWAGHSPPGGGGPAAATLSGWPFPLWHPLQVTRLFWLLLRSGWFFSRLGRLSVNLNEA